MMVGGNIIVKVFATTDLVAYNSRYVTREVKIYWGDEWEFTTKDQTDTGTSTSGVGQSLCACLSEWGNP